MGYYTRFNLTFEKYNDSALKPEPIIIDGIRYIPEVLVNELTLSKIAEELDIDQEYLEGGDSLKWYTYREQMLKLSMDYPAYLFTLNGRGEEAGDIWVEYYLKGQYQREQVNTQLDPFDLAKLKDHAL